MNSFDERLYGVVKSILGPDGTLVRSKGFKFNENQLSYAMAMAEHFVSAQEEGSNPSLGALQAGTGTGKTIGYLVPMLAYIALSGKKGIVSTYTRALQAQIMRDAAMVQPLIEQETGAFPIVRKRLGKRNYLSWSGIDRMELALDDNTQGTYEAKASLRRMRDWLGKRDGDGNQINSGLVSDFAETEVDGVICPLLDLNLLALTSSDDEEDHAVYARDVALSKDANLIVVNHATLLIDAISWGGILDTDQLEHDILVVDEADQLESAAEMINNADISLFQAGRVIKAAEIALGVRGAHEKIKELSEEAARLYSGVSIIPISASGKTEGLVDRLTASSSVVGELAERAQKALKRKGLTDVEKTILAEVGEVNTLMGEACRTLNAVDSALALSWSPVKAYPSIRIGDSEPGRVMSKYWAGLTNEEGEKTTLLKSIVFTSATLGPPGKRLPEAFDEFLNSIGVFRKSKSDGVRYDVRDELMAMYEPSQFGRMEFVLCDPSVPLPSVKEDENITRSPEWVAYAQLMIRKAHEAGGRVLVLTVSYSDAELLMKGLEDLGNNLLNHERGARLADCAKQLQESEAGILITPAGWEGLNLPGVLSHVVITRLPFMRPDSTSLMLMRLKLSRLLSEKVIEGKVARRMLTAVKRRLTQGMGRLIRSDVDAGCVWIADPRFPLPEAAVRSLHPVIFRAERRHAIGTMVESVPTRFKYGAYEESRVLSKEGELVGFGE